MSRSTLRAALPLLLFVPLAAAHSQATEPEYTAEFPLKACDFVPAGGNPWFRLTTGRQLYFTNQRCVNEGACDELEELWITVLPETRKITIEADGKPRIVRTRVVEEYETSDGEPKELSRNFYSTCMPELDVYYFGEDVFDGEGNPMPDGWSAGQNGNRPGIIMPGPAFLLGSRYYQELAPGVALDRAEHVAQGLQVEVPAGVFKNCIEILETSPLDPGHESRKLYCPNIGLVQDDDLELTAIYSGRNGHGEDD